MKRLLFSIFIFSLSLQLLPQTKSKLDSLLVVSKTQEKLVLVNILNKIYWEYRNSIIGSALFYAKRSLSISEKLEEQKTSSTQ
jgi:hypothetical protein